MMNHTTTLTFATPESIRFHYHVDKWDEDYDLVTTVTFKGDNGDSHRIEILGEIPKATLPESMQQFFKFSVNDDGVEVMEETFFSQPNGIEGNGFTVEVDVRDHPTKWIKGGTTDITNFIDTFKYYEEQ